MKPSGVSELKRARNSGLWLMGAVFLFSIFVNLLMLTGPLFMLQVYDRVLGSRSEETLLALFILVAALYGLMGLLDYARGRVLARFGARFQEQLDSRVFLAALKRALSAKERAAPARGMAELETIRSFFASPIVTALFDIPWSPIFFAAIFILHPMLGWTGLAGGAVLVVAALTNQFLTAQKTRQAQSQSMAAQNFGEQARRSAEVVQAQGMGSDILARWLTLRDKSLAEGIKVSDWTGGFAAFTKTFRLFLQSATLAAGAYLVLKGELTAGAMIAASILLGRALAPIEQTLGQWPMVQRSMTSWRVLGELLAAAPMENAHTPLPRPTALMQASQVSVVPPGAKAPTLSRVSFTLQPGTALGVIGKSGSGKSTLARAVTGLWPPLTGEIRLGGATLDQYGDDDLGRHIGYLPQAVTLFTGSVTENIARMSQNPDAEGVIAAARAACAHDLILSLPKGYDTIVGGGETELSGGQVQRIGLARALYGEPVLQILDEPNSALDAEGSEALNQAVRAFKKDNRAVIIMTHRPMAISECETLLVLEQGKVKAEGPRDEVLRAMVKNAENVKRVMTPETPK